MFGLKKLRLQLANLRNDVGRPSSPRPYRGMYFGSIAASGLFKELEDIREHLGVEYKRIPATNAKTELVVVRAAMTKPKSAAKTTSKKPAMKSKTSKK